MPGPRGLGRIDMGPHAAANLRQCTQQDMCTEHPHSEGSRFTRASNRTCATLTEGVDGSRHDEAVSDSRYARLCDENLDARQSVAATEYATDCNTCIKRNCDQCHSQSHIDNPAATEGEATGRS